MTSASSQHNPFDRRNMYGTSIDASADTSSSDLRSSAYINQILKASTKTFKQISSKLETRSQSRPTTVAPVERTPYWKTEAEQLQEQLIRRWAQLNEQVKFHNEELLRAAKDYRSRIEDSTQWDKGDLANTRGSNVKWLS